MDRTATRSGKSDHRGQYVLADLTRVVSEPSLRFEWRGIVPPEGRSWRYQKEKLQQLEDEGRIFQRRKRDIPNLKIFLNEDEEIDAETIWADIPRLSATSKENTQYSSQKPLGLLERLLHKGSNEGQVVLDPFRGSGTTILAAERHRRRWIACDTYEEAITIASKRLVYEFGESEPPRFLVSDTDSLRQFPAKSSEFRRIAVGIDDLMSFGQPEFVLNHEVLIEETRHFEFKEIKSIAGAVDSIVNSSDEYAVAFLNGEGGRVYWGIRDKDRIVVGIRLTYQ